MRPSIPVRKVQATEVDAISQMLARAFLEDPVLTWLIPSDRLRDRLELFFASSLRRLHLHLGEVYVTEDLTSAAIWDPPGHWKVSVARQLVLLPDMLRIFGANLPRVIKTLDAIQKRHIQEPHFYLSIIGTEPSTQGRGAGKAAMAPVLERCDETGTFAYLESSNVKNVPFYGAQGFQTLEVLTLGNGAAMTLMRRPPKPAAR